jgi:hypothetical protein
MIKRRLKILALMLGVAATIACFSNVKNVAEPGTDARSISTPQDLTLEVPNGPWERVFFEALEERTKQVNLPSLRAVLPLHDLEVRFWYDHFEVISGLVLRRSGEKWSATILRQEQDHVPSSMRQRSLGSPKSGWEVAWKRLTNAGVMTLPDESRTKCKTEALDGIGYVVEINSNRKYRTYRYGNPQFGKCDEAKRIVEIEEILADEFGL